MAQDRPYRYSSGKEESRGTIVTIAVLLVLILAVGGGLLYIIGQGQKGSGEPVKPNQTNVTKPIPNVSNNTTVAPVCDDQCLLGKASDISGCAVINSTAVKETCYEKLSGQSLDACKAVADKAKKSACITHFAVSGKDPSICDSLAEGRDACRHAVDPCIDSADKKLCAAVAGSKPALCGPDTSCLLNYSFQKNDSGSCSLIQNAALASACVSKIKNTDRCSDLPRLAERDLCYEMFAIYSGDYLTCTQITDDTTYAIDCFSVFAASMHDLSICDTFALDPKWACYTNYSLISGDLSGCTAINPLASTNRFKCSFEFAKKYGNPGACEAIIDSPSQKKTCYEGTIIYSNSNLDYRYCKDVTNFQWKNSCYTEAAKLAGDKSICSYITEDFAKQSCISSVALNQTK
ncbi:MAG: hypothetical protein U0R44_02220 [Candidatus Micrarchaeia archaeon]